MERGKKLFSWSNAPKDKLIMFTCDYECTLLFLDSHNALVVTIIILFNKTNNFPLYLFVHLVEGEYIVPAEQIPKYREHWRYFTKIYHSPLWIEHQFNQTRQLWLKICYVQDVVKWSPLLAFEVNNHFPFLFWCHTNSQSALFTHAISI